MKSALVINPPFPQLTHLAASLASRGLLRWYIEPFVSTDTTWNNLITNVPVVGETVANNLRRRQLCQEIPADIVRTTGMREELLRFSLSRMPARLRAVTKPWELSATQRRNTKLSELGARLASDVQIVVASYGTALEAFTSSKLLGNQTCILDYPIANHDYSELFLREESRVAPEFAHSLQFHNLSNATKNRLDREIELADVILVGSTFARDSFLKRGVSADKVKAISYGVDVEQFAMSDSASDGAFNVLFVGQIGQRKGVKYLLDAYRQFRKSNTRLRLVGATVGDPAFWHKELQDFEHIPNQPKWKMPGIYAKADVFVLPTLIEGMGLVVAEAMASGLPVIVTANGPGDLVRDGIDGFVVPIRNSDEIRDRLEMLYRDPLLRLRMGRNARSRALEFTWSAYQVRALNAIERSASGAATATMGAIP